MDRLHVFRYDHDLLKGPVIVHSVGLLPRDFGKSDNRVVKLAPLIYLRNLKSVG